MVRRNGASTPEHSALRHDARDPPIGLVSTMRVLVGAQVIVQSPLHRWILMATGFPLSLRA